MWDLHMAEVHGEGLAPYSEVTELVNGQVAWQRQHDRLAIVTTQRLLLSILVRYPNTLRRGRRAGAYPELGICKTVLH